MAQTCAHLRPAVFLRVIVSWCLINDSSRKSPIQSHVRAWERSLLLRLRNQGVSVGALERRRICTEAATAGNASGSAARSDPVIEHQQEQLMRQRTTIDAERATRTPVKLCPRRQSKLGWPQSWKRAGDVRGWKTPVGRLVIQNATVHLSGRRRALRGACGCGSESVSRTALVWQKRAAEETSETACVHADNAYERSSTPDDHETERSR